MGTRGWKTFNLEQLGMLCFYENVGGGEETFLTEIVFLWPNCLVLQGSQFEELCGLRQIALP